MSRRPGGRLLTPDEVRVILTEFITLLDMQGQSGAVFVIGGAAVALENPNRHLTEDVDGWTRAVDITEASAAIAATYNLGQNWFHEIGRLRPPASGDEIFHPVLTVGNVTLYAANSDALLAMKLNIARLRDTEDLEYLLNKQGITSLEGAKEAYEEHYPGEALGDEAVARVEQLLSERERDD